MNDYIEGELGFWPRLQLRAHLHLCAMCRAYLDQLSKTRALLSGFSLGDPTEATEDAALATLHTQPGD